MEPSAAGEEGEFASEEECDNDGEMTYEGEDATSEETRRASLDRREGKHLEKGVANGRRDGEHRKMVDVTRDKPVKVTVRVAVPVRDHPKFNFVGKLLGPKGNSLKRLQEDTMTKMAILGRGSMKDKHKEEELRSSGDPKFSHLHDDLHVEITAFAPPAEAHARIAYALADVRRFLVPDYNDDIRQEQMWEMQILKERPPENSTAIGDALGIHLLGAAMPAMPCAAVVAAAVAENPTDGNGSPTPLASFSNPADRAGLRRVVRVGGHPVFGGIAVRACSPGVVPTAGSPVAGRKRPPFPRHSPSPTKRTVTSILSRVRVSRAEQMPGHRVDVQAFPRDDPKAVAAVAASSASAATAAAFGRSESSGP